MPGRYWKFVTFVRAICETVTFARGILETVAFARAILETCHIAIAILEIVTFYQGIVGNLAFYTVAILETGPIYQGFVGNCGILSFHYWKLARWPGRYWKLSPLAMSFLEAAFYQGIALTPCITLAKASSETVRFEQGILESCILPGLCGKQSHLIVALLEAGILARVLLESVTFSQAVLGSCILQGHFGKLPHSTVALLEAGTFTLAILETVYRKHYIVPWRYWTLSQFTMGFVHWKLSI